MVVCGQWILKIGSREIFVCTFRSCTHFVYKPYEIKFNFVRFKLDFVIHSYKNKYNAVSYQRWTDDLNFNGFPVRLHQIEKFMQQNEHIAVNVYYFDSEKKTLR